MNLDSIQIGKFSVLLFYGASTLFGAAYAYSRNQFESRIQRASEITRRLEGQCHTIAERRSSRCQNSASRAWAQVIDLQRDLQQSRAQGRSEALHIWNQLQITAALLDRIRTFHTTPNSPVRPVQTAETSILPNDECSANVDRGSGRTNQCWKRAENNSTIKFYITADGIQINESCFEPVNPSIMSGATGYFRDSHHIIGHFAEAVSQLSGCLSHHNANLARHVLRKIGEAPPGVTCFPNNQADGTECASTSRAGRTSSISIFPGKFNRCGNVSGALFHELLHFGDGDNLVEDSHNNPECRPYDAVYACSELCYSTSFQFSIGSHGCFACTEWGENVGRANSCSQFTRSGDESATSSACTAREYFHTRTGASSLRVRTSSY